jgi:uncharacterized protein DUF4136
MKQIICLALCVLVAACASSSRRSLETDYDKSAPFDTYNTFSVEAVQHEDQYAALNGFLKKAIVDSLLTKGLIYSESGDTDLVVRFAAHVTRGQKMRLEQISTGQGVYTRSQVDAVNEGALLINVVDVKQDRVIWKASSISDITGIDLDKVTQPQADKALSEILLDYPSK